VQGPSSGPPPAGRHCWPATAAEIRLPLLGSLYRWPWTARLEYSGPATVLQFRFGGDWSIVSLPAGRHTAYIPALGSGSAVSLRLAAPGAAPCVTGVTVGSLHPDQLSQAIPAARVPG
jgi:hypothetical protein